MIKSDWASRSAIVVIILLVILSSLAANLISDRDPNDSSINLRERDCYAWNDQDLCAQMRMSRAAEDQSDWSKYSLWLLGATLLATSIAAFATISTVRILRQEFIATHRPKLLAYRIRCEYDMSNNVNATFNLVNAGPTTAKIVTAQGAIFRGEESPDLKNLKTKVSRLDPGQETGVKITSNISTLTAMLDTNRTSRDFESDCITCVGRVRYEDRNGATREVGFERVLNYDKKLWIKIEDSELEYSY